MIYPIEVCHGSCYVFLKEDKSRSRKVFLQKVIWYQTMEEVVFFITTYFREMVRPVLSRDSQYNIQSRAVGLSLWLDSILRSLSYFSYRILIYRRCNWIQEGVGTWLSNLSKTDTVAYRFWICSACANSECLMEQILHRKLSSSLL